MRTVVLMFVFYKTSCLASSLSLSWLNAGSVGRYLCKLSDQELRQSAARNMADLMWSTVKEPLDSALCFDKESLDLAFKYFMSPTLTMRLAGLSQITVSHNPNMTEASVCGMSMMFH